MSELHVKIGKLLKLERQRQGIVLDDLSTKLKVSSSNLRHVEAGELKALPSELYFNLFAKSYAEALGIDYTSTVEAIKEDIGQPLEPPNGAKKGKQDDSEEEKTAPEKEGAPPESKPEPGTKFLRKFALLFGAVVILFLIVVLINKLFFSGDNHEPSGQIQQDTGSVDISDVSAAEKRGAADTEFAHYDWDVPRYEKSSDLKLKLVAARETWAAVFADGDRAIYDNLVPGRVYRASAKYRLQVSIGVPSAVEVELNGTPVNLRDPNTRRISKIKINQANLASFLNRPTRPAKTGSERKVSDPHSTVTTPVVPITADSASSHPPARNRTKQDTIRHPGHDNAAPNQGDDNEH